MANIRGEVAELFKLSRKPAGASTVGPDDFVSLPDPVGEYLKQTGIPEIRKIQIVRLQQEGFFRVLETHNWRPFKSEQYICVNPPGFIWHGSIQPRRFMSIYAKDRFIRGKGEVFIKKQPMITQAHATGADISRRCLTRFLGEMVWYPSAFMSDNIRWESLDHRSAKAIIKFGGMESSLFLYFNPENELTDVAGVSYRVAEGKPVLENWSMSFAKYRELNGILIPLEFEAKWNLKHSEFGYFKGSVTGIDYQNHQPY
ncbi:hypothetical protein JXA40_12210 [bacterium]|nr:hypothetical protein [candidate division CSSED10-310 bacterium]